jgi:outer membrane protein with beta-barrel domain
MQRVLISQFPVLRKALNPGQFLEAGGEGLRTRLRFWLGAESWQLRGAFLACVLSALVPFGRAQQIDLAVGGSTLWSTKPLTASQAFLPPAEKGGTYAGASLQYLTERRLGINIEGAFRAKEGLYNNYQYYRPALYDVNAVYARPMAPKVRADFMAGVGGETLLFYQQTNCIYSSGCSTYVNNTHFLVHAGVGVRYYVWKTFFVRPEAHYYFIPNNFEFHSDHVLRFGASIGHTFGSK